MKKITSIVFDPPNNSGTVYVLNGLFTEGMLINVLDLSQDQQKIINNTLVTLSAQLPEGTTAVERIGLERISVNEYTSFIVEAVVKNITGGVAVIKATVTPEITLALNNLWNDLQLLVNNE